MDYSKPRHMKTPGSPTKWNRKETVDLAKATAITLLDAIVEFSDAFPPLKTVATAVQFIVTRVEKAGENHALVRKLLRRIQKVVELTAGPDNEAECRRRESLTRELEDINSLLEPLKRQGRIRGFLKASDDKTVIQDYIIKVDQALSDYQVAIIQDLHRLNMEQISYDERSTLEKLARAKDAGFNASDDRPRCLEGTRVDILQVLQSWSEDSSAQQVYWLNGHAGSGKSTIAQSFAESLYLDRRLGASFFCSRESTARCDLKMIFPTIAFHLSRSNHPDSSKYRKALLRALEDNPDIASLSLRNQIEGLLVVPMKESQMATVVLIDALDECKDNKSVSTILDLLASSIAQMPTLKFFITSRPEPHIRSAFRLPRLKRITETMILHEVGTTSVNEDIRLFLAKNLANISAHRSDFDISQAWPSEEALDQLTEKAGGLFVFASTVVKFVDSVGDDPRDRLDEILRQPSKAGDLTLDHFDRKNPFEDLDILYLNTLTGSSSGTNLQRIRSILGLLAVTCDPLSLISVAGLLDVESNAVRSSLRTLHSIILVPDETTGVLRFHHKSFPDFLADPTRCTDKRYLISSDDENLKVAQRCLYVMKQNLKNNLCGLPRYSMNNMLSTDARDQHLTEHIKYCCRHWADHILSDNKRDEHMGALQTSMEIFLDTQQLMWFEVLSLIGELHRAVEALSSIREWLSSLGTRYKTALDWIIDGYRFLLASFDIIEVSAAQIYHSALIFAPENSLLKRSHIQVLTDAPKTIIGVGSVWSGPLRTISVPDVPVALEYSHDGKIIAVGVDHIRCYCHLVRSTTGERVADLDSGGDGVQALSFSFDDKIIATVTSRDIVLWDVQTGTRLSTFTGSSNVSTVLFHPGQHNEHILCSLDCDNKLSVWDTRLEACLHKSMLAESTGLTCWLARGGELEILVSTATGCTAMSAMDSTQITHTYTLPDAISSGSVSALASSTDGLVIALATYDGSLVIYNSRSEAVVHHFDLGTVVETMKFSPASTSVLAVAAAKEVRVYSLKPESCRVLTSYDHSSTVSSLAFSPDGKFVATGTYGSEVYIWEIHPDNIGLDTPQRHLQYVTSAHFSHDGRLVVSGSDDKTIRVWDSDSGKLLRTQSGHSESIQDVIFLRDDMHIVSVDQTGQTILWDLCQDDHLSWCCEVQLQTPGMFDFIAPFTHDELGFFYISHQPSPGHLECWTVDKEKTRLSLVARGQLPRYDDILRISHLDCSQDSLSIQIVLEYKSGERFSSTWCNATLSLQDADTTPEMLRFVATSDLDVTSGQGSLGERPLVGLEEPCLTAEDRSWVCDERGQKILWLPALRDGYRRRYGRKLLLQGSGTSGGQLTLLDLGSHVV